ncbi:MAG TPA: hypothetical protein VF510_07440, partial [Ktedonobacterales bacterium]
MHTYITHEKATDVSYDLHCSPEPHEPHDRLTRHHDETGDPSSSFPTILTIGMLVQAYLQHRQ